MNNASRYRWVSVLLLVSLQIFSVRFFPHIAFFPDLLFLIIAFIALKKGFMQTYLVACFLGWLTDYLCGGIIGVFGFSRVVSAALLHETVKYIDLKKKGFTFFLIFFSLALSNGIAQLFFYLINQAPFSTNMILWQPFGTAILALLLVYWKRIGLIWDIY